MRRVINVVKLLVIVITTITLYSCRQNKVEGEDNNQESLPTEAVVSDLTVEVVVDDSTGEILGIKANEVGDFYLINPGDEQMIPKEGHSVKSVLEKELEEHK